MRLQRSEPMKPSHFFAAAVLSLTSCYALALDANEEIVPDTEKPEFLVYAATWQPSFCAKQSQVAGCDAPPSAFLAHGIWPYNKSTEQKNNRHPQNCTNSTACNGDACPMSDAAMQAVLDNQKIRDLVTKEPKGMFAHEWKKHGTCSGKSMQAYFEELANLYPDVVKYDKSMFNAWVGKGAEFADIKKAFPANTSFRCLVHNEQQYLHEAFYLIDNTGKPYTEEKNLQIGIACQDKYTLIPGKVTAQVAAKPQS